MKRTSMIWLMILIGLDQGIKLLVAHFLIDAEFTIIPYILRFRTHQNIHLGWIPNMIDFMMPLPMAIFISILAIILMLVYYKFWVFLNQSRGKVSHIPHIFLMLVLSAGICKLIDDIFWGGTLDFIQLFDWFIFDIKDVYLTVAVGLSIFCAISEEKYLRKLPLANRNERRFSYWIRTGRYQKN